MHDSIEMMYIIAIAHVCGTMQSELIGLSIYHRASKHMALLAQEGVKGCGYTNHYQLWNKAKFELWTKL